MPLLSQNLLDDLSRLATESPRLRMNHNLHDSLEDTVQRMFNALEPGTNIPIARHPTSSETIIILRGKLRIRIYDDAKNVIEDVELSTRSGNIGYHIPAGTWHKADSLEYGTVCFETREGPYKPVAECDILN